MQDLYILGTIIVVATSSVIIVALVLKRNVKATVKVGGNEGSIETTGKQD